MRYILIIILLITYNTLSQNKDSTDLMDSLYNHIITKNGCSIDFEYWFENENYKMEKPITGNIVFFSQDRFFLEFNSRNQKRIQIFDGEKFMTILNQEKEIQIENLPIEDDILIKDIFTNYKTKFNHYIKSDNSQNTIISTFKEKQIDKKEESSKDINAFTNNSENTVKAPMLGTLYHSPSPNSKPFIKVGSKVKAGDVIFIIEAMKTMNQVKSDKTGTVKKILVENSMPVEFDQDLIIIE